MRWKDKCGITMNRGSMFYMPTVSEWSVYNVTALRGTGDVPPPSESEYDAPSGVYLLANYMPALSMSLTAPNLTWCVDVDLLDRYETRISVGSSYFVMDRCVLGPTLHYSDVDKRANTYVESFGVEVSNGLRWLLEMYRTTNILERNDMYNVDLAVARNIRNKLPFGSYTPVQLMAKLRETSECEKIPIYPVVGENPAFVRPFGFSSGASAPIGGVGQFTKPYLGTASVQQGFCSGKSGLAVSDPYAMNANDKRRLDELIARNREEATSKHLGGVFRPTTGLGAVQNSPRPNTVCSMARGTDTTGRPRVDENTEPMETEMARPMNVTTQAAVFPRPPTTFPELFGNDEIVPTNVNMQMLEPETMDEFTL